MKNEDVVLLVVILVLVILFGGEPDLMDAIVEALRR